MQSESVAGLVEGNAGSKRLGGLFALSVAAAGATLWTEGLVDLALYGGGALGVLVGLAGLVVRSRLGTLPLEIAPGAVWSELNGTPAYRFRVRLGRFRPIREARAEVRWMPEDGEPVLLQPLLAEAPVLLGPWTLVVRDEARRCEGPGRFRVEVRAREGGADLVAAREWAREDVIAGHFAAGMRRGPSGLDWTGDWARVEAS